MQCPFRLYRHTEKILPAKLWNKSAHVSLMTLLSDEIHPTCRKLPAVLRCHWNHRRLNSPSKLKGPLTSMVSVSFGRPAATPPKSSWPWVLLQFVVEINNKPWAYLRDIWKRDHDSPEKSENFVIHGKPSCIERNIFSVVYARQLAHFCLSTNWQGSHKIIFDDWFKSCTVMNGHASVSVRCRNDWRRP